MGDEELIVDTIKYLPIEEIISLESLNRENREAINTAYVWEWLLKRDFNVKVNPRRNYITLYRLKREMTRNGETNFSPQSMYMYAESHGYDDIVRLLSDYRPRF